MNNLRTIAAMVLVVAATVLTGCGSTLDDPPDGAVRFVNASPTAGLVEFRIVELSRGEIDYTAATDSFVIDSGPFRLNARARDPLSTGTVVLDEQQLTVTAGNELLVVLFDDAGAPAFQVYDTPLQVAGEGEAVLTPFHAARGIDPVDIYVEVDGTALAAATPRASLSFKELGDPVTVTTGQYRLTATAVGDPTTVLFESDVFTTSDATAALVGLFAGAGTTRAALRASILESGGSRISLADGDAPAALRVINGTTEVVDVVTNGDFATPLHAAVMPREVRDYVELEAGTVQIQTTPAGNMGVIETDQSVLLPIGTNQTQVLAGTAGAVTSSIYAEDNRGISSRARYRVRNASTAFPLINGFIREPGTDISEIVPNFAGLTVSGQEFVTLVIGGDLEITLVENDGDGTTEDTNVIAGPMPVTFDNGRVYDVVIFDSATAGQVDLLVIDSTAPQP